MKFHRFTPSTASAFPSLLDTFRGLAAAQHQVFSWFRRYTVTLNEMREIRHIFTCLFFTCLHNDALDRGAADYINFGGSWVHKVPTHTGGHYGCAPGAKAKGKAKAKKKPVKSTTSKEQ